MKSGSETFDLAVIGGGIFGLWVAKHAVDAGMNVLVAEKDHFGAGASGGLLGALMPHIPTGWNEKKQFQFDALSELEGLTKELEAATGIATGYGRIGRLMPLRAERFLPLAFDRDKAARDVWHQRGCTYSFTPHQDDRFSAWLSSDYARFGYTLDTLAARIEPRAYIKSLTAYLHSRANLKEKFCFDTITQQGVSFNKGADIIKADAVVLAQGYQTFSYLKDAHDTDIGIGIKGQAAQFELPFETERPVIYDDGVYIVPHENNTCSVGSTSEKLWEHPTKPDLSENGFIDKAKNLCPALKEAPLVGRWAGVRPKCHEREPIVGRLFGDKKIFIATGGFKVSFGLAHRVSEALVDEILGRNSRVILPKSFKVQPHLAAIGKSELRWIS